jgi:hypothetical protein
MLAFNGTCIVLYQSGVTDGLTDWVSGSVKFWYREQSGILLGRRGMLLLGRDTRENLGKEV